MAQQNDFRNEERQRRTVNVRSIPQGGEVRPGVEVVEFVGVGGDDLGALFANQDDRMSNRRGANGLPGTIQYEGRL